MVLTCLKVSKKLRGTVTQTILTYVIVTTYVTEQPGGGLVRAKKASRACSRLCTCGTKKLACKNRIETTSSRRLKDSDSSSDVSSDFFLFGHFLYIGLLHHMTCRTVLMGKSKCCAALPPGKSLPVLHIFVHICLPHP